MAASHPPQSDFIASRVGIPIIDDQHDALCRLTSRLLEQPEALANNVLVVDVLTELGKFLILHFKTEEGFMRQLNLPAEELAAHIHAHSAILDQYAELNMAIAEGKRHTANEVFEMTRQWIEAHLQSFDKRLADFVEPSG